MAAKFVMQDQVLKNFAGFQDLGSPIRSDTVPMLNALQMIQTYQDFHLQQQDTVDTKTEAVTHILAQIEFVQDWNNTASSAYTAYADRLLPLYNELAPAQEELRCIEQVLLPDVIEQAIEPMKQNPRLLLAMKEVVKDQIKGLGSRLADLGIRPAQPFRRRRVDRAECSIDILEDCKQITFLGQEMRQRSKTADGKTSAYEDESGQEARLIRNAIKYEEGNLVQHQAWVRGWEVVAYNENRRSFIAQGLRRDEHPEAAVMAQLNAEKARSEVESTEQHLRHLKREYVRKNKLRRNDEYSYQTILGKRRSDSDGRKGGMKRQRIFGSQTREEVLERRIIGERLASWFLEPDQAEPSSAAPAQPTAPKGFKTNGWTTVNSPAPPHHQSSPLKKPRPTTGGDQLPKTAAHPPLQASPKPESQPPSPRPSRRRGVSLNPISQPSQAPPLQPSPAPPLQRLRQTSPRPIITPAEGRRRIILGSPSPVHGPSNPAPPPPASVAAAPPQPSRPPAPAQSTSSSQVGPGNKRKRGKDDGSLDTSAASTSEARPSSKRVREQPAPAAAPGPVSATAAASVVAPPAPAAATVNAAPTNSAPAPKYVRGGVKSSFLEKAEALASHVAPDGKTRKSGRASKKRGG